MKTFIKQILLFSMLMGLIGYLLLWMASGYTDPFYRRFTSPLQSSLIIGSSRAAQALQPALMPLAKPLYNYAFTIENSPYGPTYLHSIQQKLLKNSTDGIFIVEVTPSTLASTCTQVNDTLAFRERNLTLANEQVTGRPNIGYFIHHYEDWLMNAFLRSEMYLHTDGWLEVTVGMQKEEVQNRAASTLRAYQSQFAKMFKPSEIRITYLEKTIEYLKSKGTVYMVRLPIPSPMLEVEKQLMPDFEQHMQRISTLYHIPYWDMTPLGDGYDYVEGNHLYKTSGARVSEAIADWIITGNKKEAK